MIVSGRAPNTKRLNLEAVGVELDKIGAVKVCFHRMMVLYFFFAFHVCLVGKC